MSNNVVMKVENLSKQYRIGAKEGYKTFRETLIDAAKAPFQRLGGAWSIAHRAWSKRKDSQLLAPSSMHAEGTSKLPAPDPMRSSQRDDRIWALKDVSFEVKQGEVVGIIGRNGAGKSTLLKILSKITDPTEGRVELTGRVGSLLEVGTGFHPELTGHENVYLYGAILGMDRWEVTRKFDEIIEFSELKKFVDTPVKRYSSGMYMRLAFAVAAHLEPEILLVDEVLAVGDMAFQKKCLGKMDDVAKGGRTVLFVSHNMAAIMSLCQRTILLDLGRVIEDEISHKVVDHYIQIIDRISSVPLAERTDRKGNQALKFIAFELQDGSGRAIQSAYSGKDIILSLRYKNSHSGTLKNVHIAIGVHGRFDENLFQLSTGLYGQDFEEISEMGTITCKIQNLPLQSGKYSFNLFCKVSGEIADWIQNAGSIEVETGDFFGAGKLPPLDQGSFMVQHTWSFTPP